ncbi:hypothetical protein BLOT_014159 [Blomia tropicalis]|nr:hypothetical protein BLOT_014159 [Blomia tropicalis]
MDVDLTLLISNIRGLCNVGPLVQITIRRRREMAIQIAQLRRTSPSPTTCRTLSHKTNGMRQD